MMFSLMTCSLTALVCPATSVYTIIPSLVLLKLGSCECKNDRKTTDKNAIQKIDLAHAFIQLISKQICRKNRRQSDTILAVTSISIAPAYLFLLNCINLIILVCPSYCIFAVLKWRLVRVVEGARLESVYTSKGYRGFESLSLR